MELQCSVRVPLQTFVRRLRIVTSLGSLVNPIDKKFESIFKKNEDAPYNENDGEPKYIEGIVQCANNFLHSLQLVHDRLQIEMIIPGSCTWTATLCRLAARMRGQILVVDH